MLSVLTVLGSAITRDTMQCSISLLWVGCSSFVLCCCLPQGPYLPGYTATPDEPKICYGLHRLDHAVGNVPRLIEHLEHVMGFTGGLLGCEAGVCRSEPCKSECASQNWLYGLGFCRM
jgi:hypothetical protein